MYISCDVTFIKTLKTSGYVTIQVGEQVPESEEVSINNIKEKPENKSEVDDLVVKDNNIEQKSKARSTTETAVLDAPTVMETLDSAELLIEDQTQLNYLWDFETRKINLDFSSTLSSPGLDTD